MTDPYTKADAHIDGAFRAIGLLDDHTTPINRDWALEHLRGSLYHTKRAIKILENLDD